MNHERNKNIIHMLDCYLASVSCVHVVKVYMNVYYILILTISIVASHLEQEAPHPRHHPHSHRSRPNLQHVLSSHVSKLAPTAQETSSQPWID